MRKIVLYTYHVDEERLSQTSNFKLEREVINIESRNERELIFAVSTLPNTPIRIPIASRPGLVYYDQNSAVYRVWFDDPDRDDRDKAIEAIGNYILDRIAPEIRLHHSFIHRLIKDRLNALKLVDDPQVDYPIVMHPPVAYPPVEYPPVDYEGTDICGSE